jgi:arsenate reductase
VKRAHIGFEDPVKASGPEEDVLNVFRRVRDEIRKTIEAYLLAPGENGPSKPDKTEPEKLSP